MVGCVNLTVKIIVARWRLQGEEGVKKNQCCQMAAAKFLDRLYLALWASGLWLRYATLQNLILSFPWIAPPALQPGTVQETEVIKFCHLATLIQKSQIFPGVI